MKRLCIFLLALLVSVEARAQFTSAPQCADGTDNDGDGLNNYDVDVGEGDPGCDSWNDNDESDISFSPQVKARLVVAFDTSGSMLWNVCTTDDNPDGGFDGTTGGDGTSDPGCAGNDVDCCHTPPEDTELCVRMGNTIQDDCDAAGCDNGIPDDSRIYKVKTGVYDAIAAYGEIEYSLYRFNARARGWPGGGCGGWSGTNTSGGNISCAGANRLVKFGPENQEYILQWMDGHDNWSGSGNAPSGLDFELRGVGSTPLGASLSDIRDDIDAIRATDPVSDCRPYRVVLVTDGQETCGGNPVTQATNLRNDNANVYVIGFAGGDNAIFQDEMNDIAAAGGTVQAYFADSPEQLSAALAQIVSETILVETCNGMDDDCDGVIDNGFNVAHPPTTPAPICDNGQQGACFRQGVIICDPNNPTGTICTAQHVTPPAEEPAGCNGIDDDCDGLVDDGLQCVGCGSEICNGLDDDCDGTEDDGVLPGEGDPCQLDEGECSAGQLECVDGRLVCEDFVGPTTEICDGLDNNCDGAIDGLVRACYSFPTGCIDTDPGPAVDYECEGRCRPGTQQCTIVTAPSYSMCTGELGPTTEICNGIDDDCDGTADDGFEMLGDECTRGMGLCLTAGHWVCNAAGTGLECDAPTVPGSEEVCNNVDDDCDGTVDDLPDPPPSPIGEPCGTCGGVFACRGGLVCMGGAANPEVCNGIDDDCNNIKDDGVLPEVGDPCVPTGPGGQPAYMLVGECKAGAKQCIMGGLQCVGGKGPEPETCNGLDDDCDGMRDDTAACPDSTDACVASQCVSPCGEGEFPCPTTPDGKLLVCLPVSGRTGEFCVPNPCDALNCATNEVCNKNTGYACKNLCATVNCPTGSVCEPATGRCRDCFTTGCPQGQFCRAGTGGVGMCMVDLCAGVTCDPLEMCKDGVCEGLPCPEGCPTGQRCEAGACVGSCSVDLCANPNCASGMVCNPSTGGCIPDPCAGVSCGGAACTITCEAVATCGQKVGVDVLATGGGGFQCEIGSVSRGPAPRGLLALFLLVGIALAITRRRR